MQEAIYVWDEIQLQSSNAQRLLVALGKAGIQDTADPLLHQLPLCFDFSSGFKVLAPQTTL